MAALPTYVAAGTVGSSSTADVTPGLPSGWAANDIHLMFVQKTFNDTLPTISGFSHVTGSPLATTTAGAGPHALGVYWRRAVGGDTAPTLTFSGNHHNAQILGFRGCETSGNPWNQLALSVNNTATGSVSIPGVTTTVANCLLVYAVGNGIDTGTSQGSAEANASLANVTERVDFNSATGSGGGFTVATGELATAGASGAMTVTVTSTKQTLVCIALMGPQSAPSGETDFMGALPL